MELWDLYDAQRKLTGETMVRGTPVPKGYHLVVHICIFNPKGEMLIQHRQSFKPTWSGMWDVSVGGAVASGEDSQLGARREVAEEIGLDAYFFTRPGYKHEWRFWDLAIQEALRFFGLEETGGNPF